ncbi:hypothetical protein TSAR_001456 [Trichomalopsis sarcophagae]|uniref:Lysosome-associated membrane glycoprotein 5 n=1 Tax=Trichomalopsis sarcophagae TaxID=543379 RepID=A0A232ELJ1_9HYME|nr:hypothetical protein TSAR_001456 [Trichomalopsis sarcophagae]
MKKSTALILCCALVLVSGQTVANKTTTTEKPSTTTTAPTTVPPTTPPSTTTEPTTSSTTPSTTTTSTTTTTPKPSTTTIAPSTTTVAPPPPKEPESHKWIVNGTHNNVLIVQLATQLVITYNGTDNKAWSVPINVPANENITRVNGTFSVNDETLVLTWNATKGGENVVSLSFKRDNTTKTYILSHLEASIAPGELPNSGLTDPLKLVHAHEHFNTTIGNSYRCLRLQHFNLTNGNDDKTMAGVAKVTNLRFQAFENENKGGFGLAEDCAFDTPDVVPIAVGCALAGLVVIVLVAYLISRRRSQARGYLSM